EPLEPIVDVCDQPTFVVVDVDRRRDVHRVDEAEAVLDAGLAHERLDPRRDVDVVTAVRRLERQILGRVLHVCEAISPSCTAVPLTVTSCRSHSRTFWASRSERTLSGRMSEISRGGSSSRNAQSATAVAASVAKPRPHAALSSVQPSSSSAASLSSRRVPCSHVRGSQTRIPTLPIGSPEALETTMKWPTPSSSHARR